MRNHPGSTAIHESRIRPPATEAAATRKARYPGTYAYGIQSELEIDGCSAPGEPHDAEHDQPALAPPRRKPITTAPAAKNALRR
jgi:hypothetical protein